jgi:hypothetical protein
MLHADFLYRNASSFSSDVSCKLRKIAVNAYAHSARMRR